MFFQKKLNFIPAIDLWTCQIKKIDSSLRVANFWDRMKNSNMIEKDVRV